MVSYLEFGFPFNIKYESGDAATHFLTSSIFADQDTLLSTAKDEIYGSFQIRKIGSYVNSGLIMKCFSNNINQVDYYNSFIGFGIFVLFLTGYMMYNTLEKFTKCKNSKIIALIVSLIYVMGYPLNSLLFGFEYLSLGILILCTLMHIVYYFEKEELKFYFYIIMFALINFGLFCSYYMFVPFTYSALWIYFCIYSYKKEKKIICKKNISLLGITLLVPFLLGYIYHMAPELYNIFNVNALDALKNSIAVSSNTLNTFPAYGYIYANYYSNMVPLIPLTIYYIIYLCRDKERRKELFSFDMILALFLVGFIGMLLIGFSVGRVSTYFLMKNYYALWCVLIYINFRSLMCIFEKDKKNSYIIIAGYLFIIAINLIFINMPLNKESINENENLLNLAEIFGVNKTMIFDRGNDYTNEELDILRYAKENLDFDNCEIDTLGDPEQVYWSYSLLKYVNYDEMLDETADGQSRLDLKRVTTLTNIGKIDYIIYFKNCEYYKLVWPILFDNGEIVYENEAGGIVKYNK